MGGGTRLYVRGSKGLWMFKVHDPIILIKLPQVLLNM